MKHMITYGDKGVIPENLFQHKIAGIMSGLNSSVELLYEAISPLENVSSIELFDGFNVLDCILNMRNNLNALRIEQKEFIKFLSIDKN